MLVERTDYLSAGVHIGMKSCTKYLRQFVYKVRDDGLSVFNLRKVDARIVAAAAFLSRFKNMLIVSRKTNAAEAITKFAEIVRCKHIAGRFSPGTLTNPSYKDFFEPDVILVIDPLVDEQAIREAKKKRIPVVTLCDTFNEASDLDLIIPTNNNGKKAIALVLMLLAREILRNQGKIKKAADFKHTIADFGAEITPREDEAAKVDKAQDVKVEVKAAVPGPQPSKKAAAATNKHEPAKKHEAAKKKEPARKHEAAKKKEPARKHEAAKKKPKGGKK